jgi:hypothetical protein
MRRLSERRERVLLAELIRAETDWVGIAERHRLTTSELAEWAARESTVKRLAALSALADLQTQVLLGRCRLMAASRLLTLASSEESGSAETARRACVDLLKLDRHPPLPPHQETSGSASSAAGLGSEVEDLALLLYGGVSDEGEAEVVPRLADRAEAGDG